MPVDIQFFKDDPKVGEIIKTVNKSVKVINPTGDGLKERSERIDNLNPDKYYMVVEEKDAKGVVVPGYPKYVTDGIQGPPPSAGPGALNENLKLITRIKDGSINGLNDFHTYTVRSAEPLNGTFSYSDDRPAVSKLVTNGILTIDDIKGTGKLNLSTVLSGTYEVMAVFAEALSNPWVWMDSKPMTNWTSFELEGADTKIDYIFVNKNDLSDFKVLKVIIGSAVVPGNANFNITFTVSDKGSVTPSGSISRNFSASDTVTFTLAAPTAPQGGGTWSNIHWFVGGKEYSGAPYVNTGGVLSINKSGEFNGILAGSGSQTYTIFVSADLSGNTDPSQNGPYSAQGTITVTN